MNRFFVEEDQIGEEEIDVLGGDVNHMLNVLRLDVEDEVEIVCDGYVYHSEIIDTSGEGVRLRIIEKREGENEAKTNITLYQGLAKGSKMDYVIQKGTEVGIKSFYGVMTSRSVVKLKGRKKKDNRMKRWQKIADESGKQCMRDALPKVKDVLDFPELIEILKDKDNILVPYEEEDMISIREGAKNIVGQDIHIVIGPEGGFSEDEIDELKAIGGQVVSLGNRILRTETAGLVTSAILLYEFGDI